jgi:TonB-linked SusC/RagA family outer membrane protein
MRKFLLLTWFALAFVLYANAQERTVTGKVTSEEDGSPLPGVNVIVKGSTAGTVTDSEGKYTLSAPSNSVLVFTFIGLGSREVEVGERSTVDVSLSLDVKQLAEVVVTGTGVATDKRKLGIAVESITSDKLPPIPTASIDQALVGKIAGAQIYSSSGNPGAPVSIQLRGINTLGGGTNPLIMVNGVEMASSSLNSLDLNNVERIEVVQGAAAATIYGAQGANGVIQIFTKKGKEGPIKIDASARLSFDSPLNVGNLHQPLNHSFATDASGNILDNNGETLKQNDLGLWGEPTWENGATALNNKPYKGNTKYYDHIDQLFRTAMTQNYSVNLSGGSGKTDYSFGASKNKQESTIFGALERNNFTLNIGTELFKNFSFRFTNQFVYTDNTVNPAGSDAISAALYTYPFADMTYRDNDGNHTYKFGGAGANSTNPLYSFQYQSFDTKTIDIIPSINFNYKINKFFEIDYKYGLNHSRADYERFTKNQEGNASSAAGGYKVGQSIKGDIIDAATRKTNQNSLVTATIRTDWAKDFSSSMPITTTTLVAFDWRRYQFNRTYTNFIGLPGFEPFNGNQSAVNNAGQYEDEFITYGFLVNQKIEYKGMIGVSAGLRSDYASTYNKAKKPFNFPRIDGYIRVSELGFWGNLKNTFTEFKIRAAYGEAGTQPVTYKNINDLTTLGGPVPNHSLRQPSLTSGAFDNGVYGAVNPVFANANLKIERSQEFEYGFDLGINPSFSDRFLTDIGLNLTVWDRKGRDIIWAANLAPSRGIQTIYDNYIDLASNGVQFSLDASLYETDNFGWDLITTFGHQVSKVAGTKDGRDVPLPWSSAATYTLRPGQLLGTIYGYKALTSIDQKDPTGATYIDPADAGNFELVDGRVVEKASKKVQFTSDKYYLGNTTPKFNMSFTNNLHYKSFLNFSFQIDWIAGAKTYNQTKEWMYSEGLHGDYDKAVTINGESGAWAAYYKSFYDASESNGTKDYFLENSSFVRLRNVSIGLDFAKLFSLGKLSKLQLTLTGRNIWTRTKYTGFDPEANQNTSGGGTGTAASQVAAQRGLDYWSFPNFKSYQIGLNVGL